MLAKQVSTPQLRKPICISRQNVKSSQSVKPQPSKRGNLCCPQVCHTGDVAQAICPKAKAFTRELDGRWESQAGMWGRGSGLKPLSSSPEEIVLLCMVQGVFESHSTAEGRGGTCVCEGAGWRDLRKR